MSAIMQDNSSTETNKVMFYILLPVDGSAMEVE